LFGSACRFAHHGILDRPGCGSGQQAEQGEEQDGTIHMLPFAEEGPVGVTNRSTKLSIYKNANAF